MNTPKLTVMLPVYDAERYLREAMDSILAQSFRDFELIAVDDGSGDKSAEILDGYAAKDSRVRVIRQTNGGVSVGCNAAIDAGSGQYLARMDADDIAWPDRFEKQVSYLDTHPKCVGLGTCFRIVDPEGRLLRVVSAPLTHEEIDARHASGKGLLSICNPSVMMRMDAVRTVGKYDVDFRSAHDIEIFLRLAEVGTLANLPDILFDYRMHMSSIGHAGRSKQLNFAWLAAKMAAQRRGTAFSEPEPDAQRSSERKVDIYRKWGWWALKSGEVAVARHYAGRVLLEAPTEKANWHFAMIALRGG
ncbi:glycosyltransferase family A protein [Octadecabacter sp. 1_MG-2023]|uniref:glycosyltransferase family 2 protein n=1 Tax=unclassified Octadecabacter TaxID=196158 RepID=UPI001C08DCC7|nr:MULTISPECIES: glycosyltransferase family A protein [unclassified Octadecabacter]MBU2994050.1 glycosyltransferase family 2 protein [Octadecabacter sp. B2R22]MDO6736096.1 glycosyltransferase family A protein [Octadecabacter sp. 1_MG-2023]